jgi:hypothetical protein
MRARRTWGWLALIAYACAVSFPHQNVQTALNPFTDRFGRELLYEISVSIALVLGLALTLLFIAGLWKQPGRGWMGFLWALVIALMVAIWRLLMANNTELVHYPQYFPEGVALMGLTLSPVEAMAWIGIFGWLDEGYQYIYLTHGRITLLDFNDIYMDLAGGAAGIIFAMVLLRAEPRPHEPLLNTCRRILRSPGVVAVTGILLAGALLLLSGKLLIYDAPGAPPHWFSLSRLKTQSFWYFQPLILGPHHFHELMPPEGILLILLTIPIFAPLERRLKFLAEPAVLSKRSDG